MAIAIAFPAFDLGRSVVPIFLLMDQEENLSNRSLNFLAKCTIEFRFFKSLFTCTTVQMSLEGLSIVKTLATLGIVYATDPLLQTMTKIVCFR